MRTARATIAGMIAPRAGESAALERPPLPSLRRLCCAAAVLALLPLAGGCSKDPPGDPLQHLAPTGELALSPGNEGGQDEDPSILRAADGKLYVAWYSNRNGLQAEGLQDKEIFLARSSDGKSWTDPPVQVTRSASWAFAPSLAQDDAGVFHLAWWRWTLTPAGCVPPAPCGVDYRIAYKSSPDGVDWNLDEEAVVADGPADWLPSLVFDRVSRRMLLYFASPARDADGAVEPTLAPPFTVRLYVTVKGASGWSQPRRVAGIDTGHDTYPFVVQRSDGTFLMTWTRYDAGSLDVDPVSAVTRQPSTETMYSTSADGLAWTAPVALSSNPGAVDVFPSLYADQSGVWHALWLTNAADPNGATVEVTLGASPSPPVSRPEIAGYTGRVVATATPDVYWGAWVSGTEPTQKVRHAFFER